MTTAFFALALASAASAAFLVAAKPLGTAFGADFGAAFEADFLADFLAFARLVAILGAKFPQLFLK